MADKGNIVINVDGGNLIYDFNKEDVVYTKTEKKKQWNADKQIYEHKVLLYIYLRTQNDPIGISILINTKTTVEEANKYIEYIKDMCK